MASNCSDSCGSCRSGGCHDYGSRAERAPSLLQIDVVEGLLARAGHNMRVRAEALESGEMSPEEFDARAMKLVNWLLVTFTGGNPHFEAADEWLPSGLADYLRERHPDYEDFLPDQEVVLREIEAFVNDIRTITLSRSPSRNRGIIDERLAEHAAEWARIFTGIAFEEELEVERPRRAGCLLW